VICSHCVATRDAKRAESKAQHMHTINTLNEKGSAPSFLKQSKRLKVGGFRNV
jgi:hypothetical protein